MRSIDLSTSVGDTEMFLRRASWICSCSVSSWVSTWPRSLIMVSGVGCRPEVETNSRMRWRRSYSVMIASLTMAATPSLGPESDCTAAPGGGLDGAPSVAGAVLAAGGAAGGPDRFCASEGTPARARIAPRMTKSEGVPGQGSDLRQQSQWFTRSPPNRPGEYAKTLPAQSGNVPTRPVSVEIARPYKNSRMREHILWEQAKRLDRLVPGFQIEAQDDRGRGRQVAVGGEFAPVGQADAQALVLVPEA